MRNLMHNNELTLIGLPQDLSPAVMKRKLMSFCDLMGCTRDEVLMEVRAEGFDCEDGEPYCPISYIEVVKIDRRYFTLRNETGEEDRVTWSEYYRNEEVRMKFSIK